jgi:hypothetical protein
MKCTVLAADVDQHAVGTILHLLSQSCHAATTATTPLISALQYARQRSGESAFCLHALMLSSAQ